MLVHQRTSQDLLCHPGRMTQPTLMSTSREKVRGRLSPVLGTQDIPKRRCSCLPRWSCEPRHPASQGTTHTSEQVTTLVRVQGSSLRPHTRNLDKAGAGAASLLRDESSPSPRAQEKHLKKRIFFFFLRTLCRDCADQAGELRAY